MTSEQGRSYPIEGIGRLWSVTTILSILEKPALVQWAANCAVDHINDNIVEFLTAPENAQRILAEAKRAHTQKKDAAADKGTLAHDWIEQWITTGVQPDLPDDEDVCNALDAFGDWAKNVDLYPLASEIKVWHQAHRYAGRFDMIATLKQGKQRKPRTYLIDIKTSNGIYDTMLYQLAAYEEAYKVCDGTRQIDGRGIIRLDKKTGKPEWKEYSDMEQRHGWEIFRRLADIYYLIKGTPQGGNK